MPIYDLVIRNGLIFDGARVPRYRGDIGIRDGVIAAIGHIPATDGARAIDAGGLHVAPGFIDLHTHTMRNCSGTRIAACPAGTASHPS